jgi:hypothetical protein
LQSFEAESKGFQFTFSASTIRNFTEPKTPLQNKSLVFERAEIPTYSMSQAHSLELAPSPPLTEYSSSSSCMFDVDSDRDSDSMPAPPSPTPHPKKSSLSVSLSEASAGSVSPIKRTFTARMASPPVSPEKKKKKTSAIHDALQKSPDGLMKFFKKCTPVERNEQVQRATEEESERYIGQKERLAKVKSLRETEIRENARLRQQRHRQQIYDNEIAHGKRTPGGTKRIQKVSKP